MTTEHARRRLASYVTELERALADAPAASRAEIVADVTAHAEDALEQGRGIEEVLGGLGPVDETAEQYRLELGLNRAAEAAPTDPAPTGSSARPGPATELAVARAATMLHGASAIVAVLTGCFVSFLAQVEPPPVRGSAVYRLDEPATLLSAYGLGAVLLAFVPALLAVLPLVLPQRARVPVAVADAAVVALLAALTGAQAGLFYVPLAVLMWAAVIVPWRVSRGVDLARSPLPRALGGVLLGLPALLVVGGMLSGALMFTVPAALIALAMLALATLFALGARPAAYVAASLGLAVMVLAMLDLGLLTLAAWWTGGAYLVVGLSGVATLRPRGGRAP